MLPRARGELCVTTDAVVEGVHFTRPAFSLEDVGHKALAVNLSDLAAMGAAPAWFVCAVAMPRAYGLHEVRALAKGMAPLAREHRLRLVGGNFTAAPELSLTLTCAGEVPRGRALLRSGARPGDLLYVSGALGEARLGLRRMQAGALGRSGATLRQKRPSPRVRLGLAARGFATAAIDLSDGLAQDLGHLCDASRVGARVELGLLPAGREVREAIRDPEEAALFALAGGEDYELLLAVPPRRAAAFERACRRLGEGVTRIGALTARRGIELLTARGARKPVPRGWDHFRGDI